MQKDLSKWNKQELQAYLIHHNLKKSGNKPDLLLRVRILILLCGRTRITNAHQSGYERRAAIPGSFVLHVLLVLVWDPVRQ